MANKTYLVHAKYLGDANFTACEGDASFNVSKVQSTITVKVDKPALYAGDNVTISGKLVDGQSNKSDSPSSEAIDDLRRPARKFYYNPVMTTERKLELLKKMIEIMDNNGKNKIPVFDIDSQSMQTKKRS